jgi:hypothetical protein
LCCCHHCIWEIAASAKDPSPCFQTL